MRWYERHIDASLTRWSLGELSPSESARLLRHAHGCARCGARYEQWARAHRALEGGNLDMPSSMERQALTEGGLAAALAAAAPAEEARARWPSLAMLAGAVAAVFLAVVLTPPATDTREFTSRGEGTPPPGVALRIFCAAAGQPMRELHAGDDCQAGAMLAFAAGGTAPYSHVAVQVRGAKKAEVTAGPFVLSGPPGREGPLELTVPMPQQAGVVEVTAAFADHPAVALAALRGEQTGGVVVLKQEVKVKEGP
ncbi:hypothetical protein [Myxococcus sp. RHSTA-1-4]|uniref:hypothetical protein n=1 Tax=Myxococcus sp. RHSTA-1-4 TaxID=2874601 RepID=UPI001CBC34B6|nr:hypothetical protein [Myxococcus sp. RHSTA-1-4]MBZ4416060.1 hypothetical protein [Myxococcus sp. RHSTA-1-4]